MFIPMLAVGSLFAGTPKASADEECLAPVDGMVVCDLRGDNYPDGISYNAGDSSLELIIQDGTEIVTDFDATTNDLDGIDLDGTAAAPGSLLRVETGNNVSIFTGGMNSDGLQVHAYGGNVGIEIETGADITVQDYGGSHGIIGRLDAQNHGPTDSTGNIRIWQRQQSTINVTGAREFEPGELVGAGIYAINFGYGSISIQADGRTSSSSSGEYAYGINGWIRHTDDPEREVPTGNVEISLGETGFVSTDGNSAVGIYALNEGLGAATVSVAGRIETARQFSDGAFSFVVNEESEADATITVEGTGSILAQGDSSYGAWALNYGSGAAYVLNRGEVRAPGANSVGLGATAAGGYASVDSHGTVTAAGEYGIGISSQSSGAEASVEIFAGSTVMGGFQTVEDLSLGGTMSAGVVLWSENSSLINAGSIRAGSDRAVADGGRWDAPLGALTITNSGDITGFLEFAGIADNRLINVAGGIYDVRHFADTDGDGTRDIKRVAISDFGGENSRFDNQAGATVRLAQVEGNGETDATSYFVPTTGVTATPLDSSFYDLNRDGIVQGQFVNLSGFDHAGTIDLRGSQIGNTLVITSNPEVGESAGANLFTSNGGRLLLNTYFNEGVVDGGGTGSYSDVLVLDSTVLGTGPTRIVVDRREGPGALTSDNGILLVEVRYESAEDVFTLQGDYVVDGQQRIVGGMYSYALFHNGVADGAVDDSTDGNWYLRNVALSPTVPIYQEYPKVLLPLVDLPTLHQRVGNRYWRDEAPAPTETVFCKDASQNFRCTLTPEQASYYVSNDGSIIIESSAMWGRIEGSRGHFEAAASTTAAAFDATTWRVEAGFDGLLSETERGKLIGGVSVQYGRVNADVLSEFGSASINVNGYGFGGSLTWYAQNGLYADAQAQATWSTPT